ncbi:MAG: heat-inducible transcriptional repressor HrcA [Rhodobiaceae bacterium]|nr:heat-inducible transcriptional repressor HrcA [Rhodobiaceae bacterium]MCC0055405.1 heat-inducible transcriptional repressor HrcA [Rhodobiaceae bacterium]
MDRDFSKKAGRDGEAESALAHLDQRSREIFRRIVEGYLETGEPVGSRNLSRMLPMSLSPASVRNVMADLESLGLLFSPHTSAGRLPTETGLRFFVDAFMQLGELADMERQQIDAHMTAGRNQNGSTQGLLDEAGNLLSGLTRGAGLVLTGKQDMRVKHIEFVRLEPRKVLVVLVGADNVVENRVIDLDQDVPPSSLNAAMNWLNAHIEGRTLSEIRREVEALEARQRSELDTLTKQVIAEGIASWAGVGDGRPAQLIVRGHANLLENLQAQEDLERIRQLFSDLERKKDIVELLGLAEKGDGVRLFIGSENKLFSMSGSSLVIAPYRNDEAHIVGVIGVIGPTRINYARVIPVVDYTAQLLGRLIGNPL